MHIRRLGRRTTRQDKTDTTDWNGSSPSGSAEIRFRCELHTAGELVGGATSTLEMNEPPAVTAA